MKKLILTILICILSLALISCSAKENDTMSKNTSTPSVTEALADTATAEPTATPTPTATPKENKVKVVALTFDDGPTLDTTPLVLDKLEKHGVVASFFLIGKNIDKYTKPLLERELALGCEIDNHSWSHEYMNQMTSDKIKEEIQRTTDRIIEMTGVTPKFFRPPYIAVNNDMYENIEMPFVNGINCQDWDASVGAKKRAEAILTKVQDGDIVLLHDFSGNNSTVEALDAIIEGLKEDGYSFVTLSQLFEIKGVDPNIEYKMWTNPAY